MIDTKHPTYQAAFRLSKSLGQPIDFALDCMAKQLKDEIRKRGEALELAKQRILQRQQEQDLIISWLDEMDGKS